MNLVFPAYPVDAAGCRALKEGGPFKVDLDPEKTRRLVRGGRGMRFDAIIVPDTPVFRFYTNNSLTFIHSSSGYFPASMQCFTKAVQGLDKLLTFAGLPPGKYIALEVTHETITYVGDEEGIGYGPVPLILNPSSGGIEAFRTHTPVWREYERMALVGTDLVISANGSVNASRQTWLYSEGY